MELLILILFLIYVSCPSSGIVTPSNQPTKVAEKCLEQASLHAYDFILSKKNFHTQFLLTFARTLSLSGAGLQIQDEILKNLHKQLLWSIEVFQHERKDFVAYSENCYEDSPIDACIKQSVMPFKTHLYVMIVESLEMLHKQIDLMSQSSTFNIDALFILYLSRSKATAEETFHILYRHSVRYLLVMIQGNFGFQYHAVRMENYGDGVCFSISNFNILMVATCENGQLDLLHQPDLNVFNELTPKDYKGCTSNVHALPYEPFVIGPTSGIEVDIVRNIIGKTLNISFSVTLYRNETLKLGDMAADGSWTGFLEPIFSQWYLGIGNIPPETKLTEDFTYSVAYHWNHNVYVVPISALVPGWRVLMAIFTVEMWGVCFAGFIGFAIACHVFRSMEEIEAFRSFLSSFFVAFQVILAHPLRKLPKSKLTRVFFIGMASLAIILNCVYTCSLIYFLQNPVREHQISTQEEIVDRLVVGGSPKYREMFESEGPKEILDSFQTVNEDLDSQTYWLKKVANQRNICTIGVYTNILYLLSSNNPVVTDRQGGHKVFVLKKHLRTQPARILMRQGNFLETPVNYIVQKLLLEAGLYNQLFKKYTDNFNLGPNNATLDDAGNEEENGEDRAALSNNNLQGAYAILALGLMGGSVVLIAECLCVHLFQEL
ncbi:uncharacterized protein [Euwallacea fornicatus]|uniref:uncharacterized protein n=1 Tax=Euwallacea fornicatus TaxID=995702 RepID=UPI00338F6C97